MDREASADMRTIARLMRDMYDALVNEGFTEKQALTMIGQMMSATIAANTKKDDE